LLEPVSEQRADYESIKSDEDKFESLTEASMKGQWDVVELLLNGKFKANAMYKASYNALRNKFAGSMLHHAAGNGYGAMVRLCLDNAEDIDFKGSNSWRALHFAADAGHDATVQQLLDRVADKEARTNDGSTALHLAVSKGHDSTAQLLIRKFSVDKKTKNNLGQTALFLLLRYR
jgi:ankyrin repeat protein